MISASGPGMNLLPQSDRTTDILISCFPYRTVFGKVACLARGRPSTALEYSRFIMWLSTRCVFQEGDEGWAEYLRFIGLPELKEVRSLDTALNSSVNATGSYQLRSAAELGETLQLLPRSANSGQYYLLVADAENEEPPPESPDCRLLGYDLSDETQTSSLLNCGEWTGRLAPLVRRHNRFGLLNFDDARLAKALLPSEWLDDPHSEVTIWALYEIAPGLR